MKRYIKTTKRGEIMVKKNGNSNGSRCMCSGVSGKSVAVTLIIVGAAYALQNSGILFTNVVLWPWVLIALGICTYLCK